MPFLDHIALCNRHDAGRYRPFLIEGLEVGHVRDDWAERLALFADAFAVTGEAVVLRPDLDTPQDRAAAFDAVGMALNQGADGPALRGERYRVVPAWGEPMLATIDRGMVSLLGVRAFGVHVNGFVRQRGHLKLWIAKRAADRAVAPGKLDNLVAGGQPAHLTLMENLVKEAAEEAAVPAALARTAKPVGAVNYCHQDQWGLKPDTMFCFDLELPHDFHPVNTDGEVAEFALMDVDEVAARVRATDDFKFNVNLVLIDFLIRHGILTPDDEPDYAAIAVGLRRG
jgi:8-oxo-dGTP pyrophosphatase MutT (NUDIX family)